MKLFKNISNKVFEKAVKILVHRFVKQCLDDDQMYNDMVVEAHPGPESLLKGPLFVSVTTYDPRDARPDESELSKLLRKRINSSEGEEDA